MAMSGQAFRRFPNGHIIDIPVSMARGVLGGQFESLGTGVILSRFANKWIDAPDGTAVLFSSVNLPAYAGAENLVPGLNKEQIVEF